MFARESGALDVSSFAVGAVASLVLLALAGWIRATAPASERTADLVSWPVAAGALGAGLMLAVALDGGRAGVYAGGSVVLALGVAGYLVTRSAPFVVTVLAAIAVLYIQAFDDILGRDSYEMFGEDGNSLFLMIGAAATAFVVIVTVAGWFLPETRILTGVLAGIGGLFALAGVMQVLMVSRAFQGIDAEFDEEFDEGMPEEFSSPDGEEYLGPEFDDPEMGGFRDFIENNPYRDDIYVILGFCALLSAFWISCSLITGHIGFRLLLVADAVAMIPLALFALAASHTTWWGIGLGVAGLAALAGTAYRARSAIREPVPDPR